MSNGEVYAIFTGSDGDYVGLFCDRCALEELNNSAEDYELSRRLRAAVKYVSTYGDATNLLQTLAERARGYYWSRNLVSRGYGGGTRMVDNRHADRDRAAYDELSSILWRATDEEHSPSGEWCDGCHAQIVETYALDVMGGRRWRESRGVWEHEYNRDLFLGCSSSDPDVFAYQDRGDGRPVRVMPQEGVDAIKRGYMGAGFSDAYMTRALEEWRDAWRKCYRDEQMPRDSFGAWFVQWHRAQLSPVLAGFETAAGDGAAGS